MLNKFLIVPGLVSEKELLLKIKFTDTPFPASKEICEVFNLPYGRTIGVNIKLIQPKDTKSAFNNIFISEKLIDSFLNVNQNIETEIYATLKFSEKTVNSISARFISRSYQFFQLSTLGVSQDYLGKTVTESAEGHIILLLKDFKDAKKIGGKETQ